MLSATGCHAIVIVGDTREGLIVQNSWGDHGFALLPYEDFLLHVTDVWVTQLACTGTGGFMGGAKCD